MGMWKEHLFLIEAKLQMLIEGSAARLFPGRRNTADVVSQLVKAMYAGLKQDSQGLSWAPNIYLMQVPPHEAEFYETNPALLTELTNIIDVAATDAGILFDGKVVVRIDADPKLSTGGLRVTALNSSENLPETTAVEVPTLENPDDKILPAFLIVDGTYIFSLSKPIVNIGRRVDNDLVIDDQRVSRLHAQLRWVRDKFILFDLDSAGGTWVNNVRINQVQLSPGDVISLAGVPLVFGVEDEGSDRTQELVI